MIPVQMIIVFYTFMRKRYILKICLLYFFCMWSSLLNAQSLGLNNSSPNASAILDATSTSQGILIPRMTTAQRNAIASPATGLLVYVTDKTTGFSYYDGTAWISMFSPTSYIIRKKTADESVCGGGGSCSQLTGTTLQNDDELVLPLQANQSYVIEGFLFMISASATPDCKIAFTVPAGATMILGFHANYGDNNTTLASDVLTTSGTASSMIPNAGAGKENPIFISGTVIMGATAGNLTLQWAQNTNNSNSTTIRANSYIKATLVQ